MHFHRWIRHGDPLALKGLERTPLAERFWPKVDKNGPVPVHQPDLGPCWLWTGCTQRYGKIKTGGKKGTAYAHRLSYEWAHGPVPAGLELDHLCDTTRCVNPAHLEAVTHSENELRKVARRRLRAAA